MERTERVCFFFLASSFPFSLSLALSLSISPPVVSQSSNHRLTSPFLFMPNPPSHTPRIERRNNSPDYPTNNDGRSGGP
jgi:hypothetical protein